MTVLKTVLFANFVIVAKWLWQTFFACVLDSPLPHFFWNVDSSTFARLCWISGVVQVRCSRHEKQSIKILKLSGWQFAEHQWTSFCSLLFIYMFLKGCEIFVCLLLVHHLWSHSSEVVSEARCRPSHTWPWGQSVFPWHSCPLRLTRIPFMMTSPDAASRLRRVASTQIPPALSVW